MKRSHTIKQFLDLDVFLKDGLHTPLALNVTTRDGLDSVLEEAWHVDKETNDEDRHDRRAGRAQVDQRFDVKRMRDGHVASNSHRDRQPANDPT